MAPPWLLFSSRTGGPGALSLASFPAGVPADHPWPLLPLRARPGEAAVPADCGLAHFLRLVGYPLRALAAGPGRADLGARWSPLSDGSPLAALARHLCKPSGARPLQVR